MQMTSRSPWPISTGSNNAHTVSGLCLGESIEVALAALYERISVTSKKRLSAY